MKQMRVGIGIDVHAFEQGRKLILAGVEIPYHQGLAGHSDADVLTHAIMDGMLGACALGSIGEYFPDNDPAFKDGNSLFLLREVMRLIANKGYSVVQLDSVVVAQLPKLAPYRRAMQESLAHELGILPEDVGIKATTSEHLGFTGRKEGMLAHAIVQCHQLK